LEHPAPMPSQRKTEETGTKTVSCKRIPENY
jgi:hypothetical protein